MIPSTRPPTDEIEEIVTKATSNLTEKIDKLEKTIESSSKQRDEKPREEKVDDILAKIKAKQAAQEKLQEKNVPEKKDDKKEEHNHEDILCPGCHKGHIHKMVGDGLKVKCTGPDCGDEYALVPVKADAECKTCHFPLKIPKTAEIVDNDPVIKAHAPGMSCPNCGGTKAQKLLNPLTFDFSKFASKK